MVRKIFLNSAIFLAIAAMLCGCSGLSGGGTETSSASETNAGETSSESETVTEDSGVPLDVSPITFTLFINDRDVRVSFDGAAAEEITARTGVTLDIKTADGEDSLDELIASGDMPDLIYAGSRTEELVSGGLLIPLDGYMEEFGGNFSALYKDRLEQLRSSDGKLYTFGTGGAAPAHFTADGTFQVRYAVLEELGYPEIKTFAQLEECLRQYKELHPESTGLLLCGSPYQQWFDTVSARVNYVLGYPDDGEFLVDNETGKAVYKWTDPRTKEFIKRLNGLYNDGLLDKSSFSLKHAAYLDRLANGNPAAAADYYEDYAAVQDALVSAGREDRAYCPLPVAFDEDTKVMFLADYGFEAADGIAVTSSCKDAERAFRFMDWLCGDEGQSVMNFGAKGVFDPETDSAAFAEPFPMRGLTEKNPDGKFYSYAAEKYVSEFTKAEKSAAEAYGVSLFSELFPRDGELPKVTRTLVSDMEIPPVSETAILLETLGAYVKTEVPKAITAPADEFDSKWAEITEWCEKNGAERLSSLITYEVQTDMGM